MNELRERPLRVTRDRRVVHDWSLALLAEGVDAHVGSADAGYVLGVRPEDAERAEAVLVAYDRENPPRNEPDAARSEAVVGLAPLNAALAVVFAMLAFYAVTGPRGAGIDWFERGSADAARIVAGELWRTLTALTLHADLAHVTANAIFGALFLSAVGRSLGPGLALAIVLLSGVGGNGLNALLRSNAHVSVGASTAVFGAVGVLSGLGVVRSRRRGESWRRVWLPAAAGLGLLAMLGSAGDRVDIWAHLLGLCVGAALGAGVALALRRPPRPWAQWLWGAVSAAALVLGWQRAFA